MLLWMVPLHGLIRHLDFVDAQGCSVISCLLLHSESITIEGKERKKQHKQTENQPNVHTKHNSATNSVGFTQHNHPDINILDAGEIFYSHHYNNNNWFMCDFKFSFIALVSIAQRGAWRLHNWQKNSHQKTSPGFPRRSDYQWT